MTDTVIRYKGFCEDATKTGQLRKIQIEAILCIFEEAIKICTDKDINVFKHKVADFKSLQPLKIPNFDIRIERMDIAKSIIWTGTFATKKRKFKIFAEANHELFYKVVILTVEREQCPKAAEAVLINLFEYAVKRQATTLARQAYYEMRDFDTAVKAGLADYRLCITRKPGKQEFWIGSFESGNKMVTITAKLERD